VLALGLATYFAHVERSRRKLFVLTIASLVWFGFVRGGCVCAIGATQNVALAVGSPSYVVPISVVAVSLKKLVFTLFFGRTFCAAVCPLGAIQELVAVRSVRVPSWLDQSLGLLAYFYLGAAVVLAGTGTAFIICRYDPFVAFFRLSGSAPMLMFGACLLLIGTFVGRPYCRFLCPYGAILRVLSRFSKWHVRIPPTDCIHCRLCEDVCPYDAIDTPTVAQSGAERSSGKRRLLMVFGLAPILIMGVAWAGQQLGQPLSSYHTEVRLAEQLRREELGLTQETTKASDAYRSSGKSPSNAYQKAVDLHQRYRSLGIWLGAWVGLVVSAKLIQLSIRRRRVEFEPNRSGCVSCGRCFWYCPVEQVRCGLISDISQVVPEART
jgi:polyferredoxin